MSSNLISELKKSFAICIFRLEDDGIGIFNSSQIHVQSCCYHKLPIISPLYDDDGSISTTKVQYSFFILICCYFIINFVLLFLTHTQKIEKKKAFNHCFYYLSLLNVIFLGKLFFSFSFALLYIFGLMMKLLVLFFLCFAWFDFLEEKIYPKFMSSTSIVTLLI